MAIRNQEDMDDDELDDLDRHILEYLLEGRESDEPWGRGTPSVIRDALAEDGVDVPTRQTINNRMKRMELAGHLENLQGKGEYEIVDDPREDE